MANGWIDQQTAPERRGLNPIHSKSSRLVMVLRADGLAKTSSQTPGIQLTLLIYSISYVEGAS